MRFFRVIAGDEVYETVRLQLDAAWNLPNFETKTDSCMPPAADAPRDSGGTILVAVEDEWCSWSPADVMLPQLLAAAAIEEMSDVEFRAALMPPATVMDEE